MIGPSEALDLETECGSGLCQYLAGDFLFHCHVAHHYVAGMWGYWRVYNTLQVPGIQNDVMAPLRELPDRQGRIARPVTSDQLVGTTVNWFGKKFNLVDNSQKPIGTRPGRGPDLRLGRNAISDSRSSRSYGRRDRPVEVV